MFKGVELPTLAQPSRRSLLKGVAAGTAALMVGFHWTSGSKAGAAPTEKSFVPNAFVRIDGDGTVTIVAKHLEMGQGSHTGLATILAEELDADWATVRVEAAPADAKRYNNLFWGPAQGTGGSSAMANSWLQLRQAGATARALLVEAAARQWNVPASEITVAKGIVSHRTSDRKNGFGALAALASTLPPPEQVALKDPNDFTLIGKTGIARVDTLAKTDGSAIYAIDVKLPDMTVAVVARPPLFGAKVKTVDAAAARAIPGVIDVVTIPRGVAVVATGMWAAQRGRDALKIDWDDSGTETRSTDALIAAYQELAGKPGTPATRIGDADKALAGAARTLTADYVFPYLAHAPMEPLTCVARIGSDGVEVWAGCQMQTLDQYHAAQAAGVTPDKVTIHTLFAGGSFGRRANAESDYIVEAVGIAKARGDGKPVKLIWTREDDIQGGRYRPLYVHRLEAGLDDKGAVVGWRHRIVGQSILGGTPFEKMMVKNGIDATSVEGAADLPYAIPNIAVDLHTTQVGVPVLWWRSVGSTHTAYSTECFIDEVAAAAGQDPLAFRRALLKDHPRHLRALELAAEKAGWNTPLPPGRARGVAVAESFNTVVAEVAEVSQGADGRIQVDRIVCAVDCGMAINPDIVKAQMEGGIGFGLGATLGEAITLTKGRVDQSNFDGYTPLRIESMPVVEVHIVPSANPPSGVGEPGVPPAGPSVANAVAALTGQRARVLPMRGSARV